MPMTFPMMLTLMRIALIPVLVMFFYMPYHVVATTVAAICSSLQRSPTGWMDTWRGA